MNRKPLILNNGDTQQLQSGDELAIPLEERFERLQAKFQFLIFALLNMGIDLPSGLAKEAKLPVDGVS